MRAILLGLILVLHKTVSVEGKVIPLLSGIPVPASAPAGSERSLQRAPAIGESRNNIRSPRLRGRSAASALLQAAACCRKLLRSADLTRSQVSRPSRTTRNGISAPAGALPQLAIEIGQPVDLAVADVGDDVALAQAGLGGRAAFGDAHHHDLAVALGREGAEPRARRPGRPGRASGDRRESAAADRSAPPC